MNNGIDNLYGHHLIEREASLIPNKVGNTFSSTYGLEVEGECGGVSQAAPLLFSWFGIFSFRMQS